MAFYAMATLSRAQKDEALTALADLLLEQQEALLAANALDLAQAQAEGLSGPLLNRLKLDEGKLTQLKQGILDVKALPDPVGQTLSKTLLDEGLILEKKTVPLGLIAIIFESRPDVVPQILSLILKSGNAVVFKGGKEATHSNRAFITLVEALAQRCPFLPQGWATLIEGREAVAELLTYPQHVDLVIPRGSNELVQHIMAATRIPVLGHADGVCHLYLHPSANLQATLPVIIDAKTQYPSACNALETLLVDEAVAPEFWPAFSRAAQAAGVTLKACEASLPQLLAHLPGAQPATEADWRTEYGDLTLAVKVVKSLPEAIGHINTYGSHHTDGILATNEAAIGQFLSAVDSASVFVNASTRFADGFRYGLGAEIGISTARTHARGPVGLEGLVSTKYLLTGQNQIVGDYVGNPPAKTFCHQAL